MHCVWIVLLCAAAASAQSDQPPPRPSGPPPDAGDEIKPIDDGEATITGKEIFQNLSFLASDEMKGRMTGSEEGQKAAEYITEHMKKHRLLPAGAEKSSFETKFGALGRLGINVCGVVPGTDAALKKEHVVFGAHFDHVGLGGQGSRDSKRVGEVHNGADDNGSGTCALLELVEAFAKKPAKRSILFLAFSGEELGLLGSKAWCKDPSVPLKSLVTMINLDMIGRSKDKYLFVSGLNTGTGFPKLFGDVAKPFGFVLELHGGGRGPSDHQSFYDQKIPIISFFTNEHEQYHLPDDDVALINIAETAVIARLAYRLGRRLADGPRPKWEKDDRSAMPRTSSRGVDQAKALLGITVAESGEEGVTIIGVQKGGLAEDAGITVEDRLLTLDGEKMTTPKQVQDFLCLKRPGTQLKLQVVRGKAKKRLGFTLELKD